MGCFSPYPQPAIVISPTQCVKINVNRSINQCTVKPLQNKKWSLQGVGLYIQARFNGKYFHGNQAVPGSRYIEGHLYIEVVTHAGLTVLHEI